jgi:hypothetical protein
MLAVLLSAVADGAPEDLFARVLVVLPVALPADNVVFRR